MIFGPIQMRWIWVGLVILFSIIEALTFNLTTVWFALAAVILVFLSFLPIPVPVQMLIFLAISAAFLFLTRPLVLKKFKIGRVKTNVDSLIGKHAIVTRQIGELESGEVKLNGQYWTAMSEGGAEIKQGTKCEVTRIEGVHAIVRPLTEPPVDSANETSSIIREEM
jgi:membrane protein implicated in regulation of membrane protease activity